MESLVVKLDISKAYDKVLWDFLEVIMQKMLFPVPFIRILLRYVQSMEFQILLDGSPRMPFFSLEASPRRSPPFFVTSVCGSFQVWLDLMFIQVDEDVLG